MRTGGGTRATCTYWIRGIRYITKNTKKEKEKENERMHHVLFSDEETSIVWCFVFTFFVELLFDASSNVCVLHSEPGSRLVNDPSGVCFVVVLKTMQIRGSVIVGPGQ